MQLYNFLFASGSLSQFYSAERKGVVKAKPSLLFLFKYVFVTQFKCFHLPLPLQKVSSDT